MLAYLAQPGTTPFTTALVLVALIGVIEAIGLGASSFGLDLDGGPAAETGLDWLNVGRLPLLILLVVFLAVFGVAGILIQEIARMTIGGLLPWFGAVPTAAALALPGTRVFSRTLARVLPRDETTAVDIESLLGRRARIVIGTARRGSPARARVEDSFGHHHFVMVEPVKDVSLTTADLLLLTAREGTLFQVIEIEPDVFSQLRQEQ